MTATHELVATLRVLKLSGMLDTLEARLAQARAGELGHLEFLQVLCEDEINRRAATALTRRVRAAKFNEVTTLEGFDFSFNPLINRQQIFDLATCRFVERHETVLIQGPAGVGKSLLDRRAAHADLADLSGGRVDGSWEVRLRRWGRPRVLILDDFGLRAFTAAQADDLYELVAERRGGSFILASNRAPADWYGLFPNPVVAEGVLDRLVNSAHHVAMVGKSFRPNQRPGRTPAANPREASHD